MPWRVTITLGEQPSRDFMVFIKLFLELVKLGEESIFTGIIYYGICASISMIYFRSWQAGKGPISSYESRVGMLSHMSELPSAQKLRQALSKTNGTSLLRTASTARGREAVFAPA